MNQFALSASLIFVLLLRTGETSGSQQSPPPFTCQDTSECIDQVGEGSECSFKNSNEDGIGACTNPYIHGCFYSSSRRGVMQPGLNAGEEHDPKLKKRVCNSEDAPDAVARGLCRKSDFDFREVRIYGENWPSANLQAWLMQILFSEIIGIPSVVESGGFGISLDFYEEYNRYDPLYVQDLQSLENAMNLEGDCSKAKRESEETYVPCAHAVPEVWDTDLPWVHTMRSLDDLAPPSLMGLSGTEGWYIPKFTAEQYPELLTYLGLQNKREFLADLFLRPTTWAEYCEEVSSNNCTTPNDVAQRPPRDEGEKSRMFFEGAFTGHFRKTDKNICESNASNCTGHIADYPCGWSSYTTAQTYHLDIALSGDGPEVNGGYTYQQLIDIWFASNATKSPVIVQWFEPDDTVQTFQGTDAEYMRVSLPKPTLECYANRISPAERCSENIQDRIGDPKGICDEGPRPLKKLILQRHLLEDLEKDEAIQSPAFDVLNDFKLSELQLQSIFDLWKTANTPREAVCSWLVDYYYSSSVGTNVSANFNYMKEFTPEKFPRILENGDDSFWGIQLASLIIASVAVIVIVCTASAVYYLRAEKVIQYAQVEFVLLLLLGLLLVGVASILMALEPSDELCVAQVWLMNMGYTIELVPLIIKVAAINRLTTAARQMRRIRIERNHLRGAVFLISSLVAAFLTVWTVLDPPHKFTSYELSDEMNDHGEYVVYKSHYCSSDNAVWNGIAVGWNLVLLFVATTLAFQMRNLRSQFNESRALAMMVYSHFVFVCLRAFMQFYLISVIESGITDSFRSLIISADILGANVIYFSAKIWPHTNLDDNSWRSSRSSRFSQRRSFAPSPVHRAIDQISELEYIPTNQLGEDKDDCADIVLKGSNDTGIGEVTVAREEDEKEEHSEETKQYVGDGTDVDDKILTGNSGDMAKERKAMDSEENSP